MKADRFDRMENRAPIPAARVRIEVECVACKHRRWVEEGVSDVPMCNRCFSPCVAIRGQLS